MKGKIKSFSRRTGYGFIESEKGDVFFRILDCWNNPMKGQEVKFDIVESPKGLRAINVTATK